MEERVCAAGSGMGPSFITTEAGQLAAGWSPRHKPRWHEGGQGQELRSG